MLRLGQLQSQGLMSDEQASLARIVLSNGRETVGYARELLGGNGILLDNHGWALCRRLGGNLFLRGHTRDEYVNLGKAITGLSAFV